MQKTTSLDDYNYITERLDDQLDYYSKKADINQKHYIRWSIFGFIASALIPVVTVISELDQLWIRVAITALGACATTATSILNLKKYHELWIKYRTTSEQLKKEKVLYLSKYPPYDDPMESAKILIKRCEDIMSEETSQWPEALSSSLSNGESSSTNS